MRQLTILATLCASLAAQAETVLIENSRMFNGGVLAKLSVLADPETNLALIMKAGEIKKAKY